MSEETYIEWANEILELIDSQEQLTAYTAETVVKLAKKLETDLCNDIVGDWFCADCDHKRKAES